MSTVEADTGSANDYLVVESTGLTGRWARHAGDVLIEVGRAVAADSSRQSCQQASTAFALG